MLPARRQLKGNRGGWYWSNWSSIFSLCQRLRGSMGGAGRVLTHPRGSFFNPAHDRRAVNLGHSSAVRRDCRRAQKMTLNGSWHMIQKGSRPFLMISVEQIRAARGLLGWSQTRLAKAAERSLPTIKRLERNDGEGPSVSDDVRG